MISYLRPLDRPEIAQALAARGVSALAVELVPRITRAQTMDALSSQANVAGYRAVLVAATQLPRYFPLLMTAAGTVPPAKVLVLGAGVAGLQAIATARRLGAVVSAFDVRPAVREQVESLGATFLEVELPEAGEASGGYAQELSEETQRLQRELLAEHIAGSDVVITTALVPGRPAPQLIGADMVASMRPGSVIVDLAAEAGGNCELTEPGETVVRENVTIVGDRNPAAAMPYDASRLYARNVTELLGVCLQEGRLAIAEDDDVIAGCLVCHGGAVVHPAVLERLAVNSQLIHELTVLALAVFVGFEVISKVPTMLHTPLMSGTNAIHGIVIVGAILVAGAGGSGFATILGLIAVAFGAINVVGGFVVTDRMLQMFRRKDET